MVVTLRIFLMGFVALVPYPEPNPHSLRIILPHHPGHIPVIVYGDRQVLDLEPLDGPTIESEIGYQETCDPDLVGDCKQRGRVSGFLLRGEEIRLETLLDPEFAQAGDNGSETVGSDSDWRPNFFHGFIGALPTDREMLPFRAWIPDFRELVDKPAIRESLFDPQSPFDAAGALTLSDLSKWKLSTFSVADGLRSDTKGGSWISSISYKRTDRPRMPLLYGHKAAIADIVVLEREIQLSDSAAGSQSHVDEPVGPDLGLFKFGELDVLTRSEPLVVFNDAIEVLIGNLTPIGGTSTCDNAIEHFQDYYRLLKLLVPARMGHCGMRKIQRCLVEPPYSDYPDVIKVVSLDDFGSMSGPERVMCGLASFSEP